jgi:hypothetical protein
VTVSAGTWSPSDNTYAYQWRADGQTIAGAIGKTYTPTVDVLGKKLSVSVTASRSGYPGVKADSASTTVAPGTLTAVQPPAISGTARVDSTLTTSPGTWSTPGLTYAYQWMSDGVPVPGATSATFSPTPADVGHDITVAVTASKAGYDAATSTSSATDPTALGILRGITRPAISGTAEVGSVLTADPGAWSQPGLAYDYRWYANGAEIAGANSSTLTLTSTELGSAIGMRVYVRKDGYEVSSALADDSAVVDPGSIQNPKAPTLSGSTRVGSTMSASAGDYSPANATVSYEWLRDGTVLPGTTGRTRTLPASDRGHRLSVRVSYSAPGYTTRTLTTPVSGLVKATSKLSVSAVAGTGRVTFTITVTATGISPPDGTVRLGLPGADRMVKVVKGRATTTLTNQRRGTRAYGFTLLGTSSMTSATYLKTVTIR